MWRSPLGREWVGMLTIGFVWAARSWLPLPTLFYWPEDAHRPWRPAAVMGTTWGESIHSSPGFSRAGQCNARRCSRRSALCGAAVPISDPVGFRQTCPLQIKEKTTLPGAPASVSGLHSFAALTTYRRRAPPSGSGILTRFPFCTLSWFWLLSNIHIFKHYLCM